MRNFVFKTNYLINSAFGINSECICEKNKKNT